MLFEGKESVEMKFKGGGKEKQAYLADY